MGAFWRRLVALWPRLAITLICLAFWRVLAAIPLPLPGLRDLWLAAGPASADGGLFGLLLGSPLEPDSIAAVGLKPFLDAWVVFWLWAVATGNLRRLQSDPSWVWRSLAWLTAGLALARSFGLALFFLGGRASAVTATAGLLTIFGLLLGTMALFALGRVIDRFGEPAGYGVWFLYGVQSLLTGTHQVARWLAGDASDPAFPAIVVAYALTSIILLASAIAVFEAVRELPIAKAGGETRVAKERVRPMHLLGGGVIVPLVLANFAISFIPTTVMEVGLGLSGQQALSYWSAFSPLPLVVAGYHVAFFIVIVLAFLLTTTVTVNPEGPAGAEARRVSKRLAALGGVWVGLAVVCVPLAFQLALGPSRPRLSVGGAPFVIGAAIFIEAIQRIRRQNHQRGVTAS
jgi:preprotein translocase subunit SecY